MSAAQGLYGWGVTGRPWLSLRENLLSYESLWAKALQGKKNKDTDQSVIVEMVITHSSRTQKKNAHMKKYKIPKEKKQKRATQ